MSYTIRFAVNRRDWAALQQIASRCENAKAVGVIDGFDVHNDPVSNTALYEIRFP